MFMDPAAFESEDLERELADAGLGGGNTMSADRTGIVEDDNPPRSGGGGRGRFVAGVPITKTGLPGTSSSVPPSSGSSYGFGTDGHAGDTVPRGIVEDGRQHTPAYGRHSSKDAGIRSSKSRVQMAPPSSTPPPQSFPETSPGGGGRGKGWRREEGKVLEDCGGLAGMGAGSNGGSTGSNSRARVLAQQREIERKRRQHALSSGGIRASDAASLSRGVVSSSNNPGAIPTVRRVSTGTLFAAGYTGGNQGVRAGDEISEGVGVDDAGYGFSPAVKQFSAPRQVEGDGYTAFNPNKSGTEQSLGLSEFDRRHSARLGDVPGHFDSDSDENSERARRSPKKPFENLDHRRQEDDVSAAEAMASISAEDSNRERRPGYGTGERAADWDDRHRPSSRTYKWNHDSNGDESGRGVASDRAWRSVGRDRPLSEDESKNEKLRNEDATQSKAKSQVKHRPEDNDGQEETEGEDRSSGPDRDRSSDRSQERSSSSPWLRRHGKIRRSRDDQHGSRHFKHHRERSKLSPRRRNSRGVSDDDSDCSDGGRNKERRTRDRRRHDDRGLQEEEEGGGRRRSSNSRHHQDATHSSSRRRPDEHANRPSDNDQHNDHGNDTSQDESGRYRHRRHSGSRGKQGSVGTRRGDGRANSGGEECQKVDDEGPGEARCPGDDKAMEKEDGKQQEHKDQEKTMEDRDGGGAPVRPGAGGEGGGVGRSQAPRDRFSSHGGNRNANAPTDGGEAEFNMDAVDLSDMKKFLISPCPRAAGVVQCYIRRNKTRSNKLFPEYTLFMKEGDRFLMCSKKRPNNATSNYLVSMRAGDLDRNSNNFLGKLRANFVGTEFQVFDDGFNPREPGTFGLSKTLGGGGGGTGGGADDLKRPKRNELGCVLYASNVLGSRGPRKMQVAIPAVSEDGTVTEWCDVDGVDANNGSNHSKAIERVKNRDYDGSLYMVNKPPRWNDQVGAYVLNFYGRVTMASVKNFQLVSTEDFDRIILQFGRVAKDEFTMDFQYPMSPFQAFAITLSSFDSKIACD